MGCLQSSPDQSDRNNLIGGNISRTNYEHRWIEEDVNCNETMYSTSYDMDTDSDSSITLSRNAFGEGKDQY